jgi:glycosyltransferase involved in cell wall biosynthesis
MVVVTILCFNEARTIGSVVLKAKLLGEVVDKIVVIDDGSWDRSAEIAKDAGAEVVSHEYNEGYGVATMEALRYGRKQDCDILITMDGDGQHDAADIPRLIKPIQDKQADIVIGSRFMGVKNQAPLYRKVGQEIITLFSTLVFGCYVSDSQCGFRAFSKRSLCSIRLAERGMGASTEIHQQIKLLGLRHLDVAVNVRYD